VRWRRREEIGETGDEDAGKGKNRTVKTKRFFNGWQTRVTVEFKKFICEARILLLHKKFKVEINFIIFYKAELVKLKVFDN
jgi:hypothetical protein